MAGKAFDDEAFRVMLNNAKQILDDSQGMVVHAEGKSVTRIKKIPTGHPTKHKGGTAKSDTDVRGGKGSVRVNRNDTAKRVSLRYISEFRRSEDMVAALQFWLTNKQSELHTLMQQSTKQKIEGSVKMFRPIQISFLFYPEDGLSVYKGDTKVSKGTYQYSLL